MSEAEKFIRRLLIHPIRCPDCKQEATLEDVDRQIMGCGNNECKVMWFWVDDKGKVIRDLDTGKPKVTRREKTERNPNEKTTINDIDWDFDSKKFDYYYP